jgi:hypothetical protein
MKSSIHLRIDPKENFDYTKFVVDHANGRPATLENCDILQISSPILHFRDDFIEYIIEHGLTTLLSIEPINEELTTPRESPNAIQNLLIKFLNKIGVTQELIIIDPYFYYPNADAAYVDLIGNILRPFAGAISNIKIITAAHRRAFSPTSKTLVDNGITNIKSSIVIEHKTSNTLHDRFWISNDRQKGILLGTSLNGLGKKYSVVDYLDDQDVVSIVNEFRADNLI